MMTDAYRSSARALVHGLRRLAPLVGLAGALAALALPGSAAAQGVPAKGPKGAETPKEKAHADAQKLVAEGVKLWEARSVEGALAKWEEAFRKEADADTLFFIARAKQIQGRFLEAVADYRKYRDLAFNPKLAERDRDEARLREMDCLKNLLQLRVRGPKGAVLTIDGKEVPWTPEETVTLPPGTYEVRLALTGGPISRKLAGTGGQTIEFGDGVAAEPPTGASAGVGTGSGAGTGAGAGGAVPPGGGSPDGHASKTGLYVGAGLAGAGALGLVGGVLLASSSNSRYAAAKDNPTGPSARDDYDAATSRKTLSTVSYIAGGVLLAGGAAAIVLWPSGTTKTAIVPAPGGVLVTGRF